mgnify:CR=1 FL=1
MNFKSKTLISTVVAAILIIVACKKTEDPGSTITQDTTPYMLKTGDFPPPQIATDNALNASQFKVDTLMKQQEIQILKLE